MGELFDSVLSHRLSSGPIAEMQQALKLEANDVPLRLLETRAVTPAPASVEQNQQGIVPYVFPDSVHAFLGIGETVLGSGEAVFPVLTSELSVGTPAENAAQAETTGSFSANVLSPARLQAAFFFSREDRARFSGMDAALRENLSAGLMDGLDDQVISGTNGLLTSQNLDNHNVTTATTFDLYLAGLVYGRVDGQYASTAAAIRLVLGSHTYGHAGRVYRNTSVDRTALDRLVEVTGGVRVSAHVPAQQSNRQNALIRLGSRQDMAVGIWSGVSLIPDEVTLAANGQIKITAVMLHAIKILRADGFYKQQVQSA